ncbi:hypothetical protein BT63DRAFT_461544 [Microthyrium microscopicum]|uniref:Uncharacterized protein n=1 Tax=Microthyrium microscopicum TaxID=703497 RepID=A0A6A6TUP7_9PEZI|nr:hypothetical protein BT63DRAFT_461544 [Microthyrium microscopicum]
MKIFQILISVLGLFLGIVTAAGLPDPSTVILSTMTDVYCQTSNFHIRLWQNVCAFSLEGTTKHFTMSFRGDNLKGCELHSHAHQDCSDTPRVSKEGECVPIHGLYPNYVAWKLVCTDDFSISG